MSFQRKYKPLASFWENYEPAWSNKADWVASRVQVCQPVEDVTPVDPLSEKPDNCLRFVCMSDTHNRDLRIDVPDGDVLLHAGDLTGSGSPGEFVKVAALFNSLPHKHKVVTPGNHELGLDPFAEKRSIRGLKKDSREQCLKNLGDSCILLEDAWVMVRGIKIYGAPWQPEFGGWAYNLARGNDLVNVWDKIPDDTDILMTHGPPIRHGDLNMSGIRSGCVDLLRAIQTRVHPKYHVFGHIHEAAGITTDRETVFVNAATCNRQYAAVQPCVVFDLPFVPEASELEHGPKSTIFQ